MQFEYVQSATRAAEVCVALRSEKLLAHDTETTGLDAHKDKVILHSISTREKTYVIDTRDVRCLEAVRPILEDESIIKLGVNLDFDYRLIKGTAGIDTEGNYDLMLAEQAIMAGLQKDGFSLEAIAKKYCKKEIDKTLQKSFIGHKGEFTDAQLEYAAKDTAELFDIADEMKKVIKALGLGKTIMTECRALPAFSDITFYGQKINTDDWKGIMSDNQTIFQDEMKNLDKFFDPYYERDLFGNLDINYKSQPQILYGLQAMGVVVDGKMIESTGKQVQKKIQHLPVIIALQKYRSAKRILEAYGQNFLDAIHPNTGRIHPAFWQYGTATGRGAGRGGLNVLNIPRDKRFRHAFITDSDRLISTVDYSGAELRILAELSGDPLTVEGFLKGIDFHCYVASMLFNREKVEKSDPIRQPTKTLNFGKWKPGRNKTYSIQGNPTVTITRAILSESDGNIGSVQRLTAQTERLRTGYVH